MCWLKWSVYLTSSSSHITDTFSALHRAELPLLSRTEFAVRGRGHKVSHEKVHVVKMYVRLIWSRISCIYYTLIHGQFGSKKKWWFKQDGSWICVVEHVYLWLWNRPQSAIVYVGCLFVQITLVSRMCTCCGSNVCSTRMEKWWLLRVSIKSWKTVMSWGHTPIISSRKQRLMCTFGQSLSLPRTHVDGGVGWCEPSCCWRKNHCWLDICGVIGGFPCVVYCPLGICWGWIVSL